MPTAHKTSQERQKAIFEIVELLKKVEKRKFFGIIFVYVKIKLYLCSAKVKQYKIMQTAQVNFEGGVQVHNEPLVAPNWQEKRYTSHNDFWNEAYADLGKRYGLDDIREAE